MNKKIKILEGLTLKKLIFNFEMQLIFDNEIILNIFNEYTFSGNLKKLKNAKVKKVIEQSEKIVIFIENQILKINMKEEAYHGPEALELIIPGESPVVWN